MGAGALQNALRRKKELEQELAQVNQFIIMHEQFTTLNEPKNTVTPSKYAEVMEGILRESQTPMKRKELITAVEAAGFKIPSRDKARYLGTILWRFRSRFINISGRGYTLKDTGATA